MLQFWKKSDHSNENCCSSEINPLKSRNSFDSINKSSCPLQCIDDDLCEIGELDLIKERSRLLKTLQEVLCDKAALNYFVQYMETKNAAKYIQCWLDIEAFKSTIQLKVNCTSPMLKGDHDSLSVSTDCDSFTADASSLNDYSITTVSESRITQSSQEVNSFCDRDVSDTSLQMKSSLDVVDMDYKKSAQHFIDDALMIFKKYIAQEAVYSIKCSDAIRNEIIENVCDVEKVLLGNCFDKVQSYIYEVLEKEYFEAFLASDYFCKHQIDVLTSGNVVLGDILYNETALFYFMEFLEQENCRSLLEFWIAATNLQKQLHDQKEFFDPIEAQNDAIVLYDKYFSLQAHCPLGFNDKVRFEVEQNICGENGLVLDCFNIPLKIVEQVLEKKYFKQFLTSQLFYKYLSELINTVESNGYLMDIENNKYSPSECSSEKSFSTNSTFLALEIHQYSGKKNKNKQTNMTIDSNQLCDPDSLWKRKRNHRLSCGRITALGKFETDLEPEPDKNAFKLRNVVRKFVSMDEDKKKEEMAWQVAEMIVKDITSITLSHEKSKSS